MVRKYNKKSNWEKKGAQIGGNIGAIATKVKNIIDTINVEKKWVILTDTQNPNNNGVVTPLIALAQGLTASTRDGDSIKLTSFSFREHITMNTGVQNTIVRSIWFLDNDTQAGGVPTVLDVLHIQSPLSPYNRIYPGRFHILSDKTHQFNLSRSTGIVDKHSMKLTRHVKFNGTVSTTAGVVKHQLFHLVIGDQPALVPTFNSIFKYQFVDN